MIQPCLPAPGPSSRRRRTALEPVETSPYPARPFDPERLITILRPWPTRPRVPTLRAGVLKSLFDCCNTADRAFAAMAEQARRSLSALVTSKKLTERMF